MKRLAIVGVLWLAGCATEDMKQQWAETMKDARGENMQMRNDFTTAAKPAPARRPPARMPDADDDD
jgi:hypothetical protein